MESTELVALLPPWLQAVLSILMFGAGLYAYFTGLFKKLPQTKPSQEVIVPSVSSTSAKAIEDWVSSIRSGQTSERERLDLLRELLFVVRNIDNRMESIDHRLKTIDQHRRSI